MNSCRTRFVNCLSLQDAALARRLHRSIPSVRSLTSWRTPNEPPQERTAGGKVGLVDLTSASSGKLLAFCSVDAVWTAALFLGLTSHGFLTIPGQLRSVM